MFERLAKVKIAVIGDFFLDRYVIGTAKRLSPEAPIPIVDAIQVEERAGGAGNVVLNLLAMGADVLSIGRIGNDAIGKKLAEALAKEGADVTSLYIDTTFDTGLKERIIASGQQIVRVDHERLSPLSLTLEEEIIELLPLILEKVDAVAISDYGKGFLSNHLLAALYRECRKRAIPTITDPKGRDFSKYAGTNLIKPNFSEAVAISHLDEKDDIHAIGERVLIASKADELIITRSEKGLSYFDKDKKQYDFPVKVRQVKDVTGAGDTVLATLIFAIANRLTVHEGCRLANVAASIVLEKLGCARFTLEELAKRYLEEESHEKIFDDNHLHALKLVLGGRPFALVGIEPGVELSSTLIKTLRELNEESKRVVVYLQAENYCPELPLFLSSSKEVDYLLISHQPFGSLIKMLSPSNAHIYGRESIQRGVSLGVSAAR